MCSNEAAFRTLVNGGGDFVVSANLLDIVILKLVFAHFDVVDFVGSFSRIGVGDAEYRCRQILRRGGHEVMFTIRTHMEDVQRRVLYETKNNYIINRIVLVDDRSRSHFYKPVISMIHSGERAYSDLYVVW